MISCPSCDIPLSRRARRCPVCGRSLVVPRWLLAFVVGLATFLFFGCLAVSGKIKARLEARVDPAQVYAATKTFIKQEPAWKEVVTFSPLEKTVVQRWDAVHWQIDGYMELNRSGEHVLLRYHCVVRYSGIK